MKNMPDMDQMLAQARELQKNVTEAMNKASEGMQPVMKESAKSAAEMQAMLAKHMHEFSTIAAAQAQQAMTHLQELGRIGAEGAQKTGEQTRSLMADMAEQSRKVVESMQAAVSGAHEEGSHKE